MRGRERARVCGRAVYFGTTEERRLPFLLVAAPTIAERFVIVAVVDAGEILDTVYYEMKQCATWI